MNRTLWVVMLTLCCSVPALAENKVQGLGGGFIDSGNVMTSVHKAKSLTGNSWVRLHGRIEKQLDRDVYRFRDHSGTVDVEIFKKTWQGVNVTPADNVEIYGMVKRTWSGTRIQAKEIVKT